MRAKAAPELFLHAARDFFYAVLFSTLRWLSWQGSWTAVLFAVIDAEWDLVAEIAVRNQLGDVYAGERVTHAVMGILYRAMLATPVPTLVTWWKSPAGLVFEPAPIPGCARLALTAMGVGVFLSGFRDLYAALELPGAAWPWKTSHNLERHVDVIETTPLRAETSSNASWPQAAMTSRPREWRTNAGTPLSLRIRLNSSMRSGEDSR